MSADYPYPVFANGTDEEGLQCFSKDYRVNKPAVTISARGTIGATFIRKPCFTPVVRLIAIIPKETMNVVEYFIGVDRTVEGWEGLMAAQQCLPTNKEKDAFGADYRVVNRAYNALSPDPFLDSFRFDYKWLSKVYESIKPVDTRDPLIWASVGAKTLELVHENIDVMGVHEAAEEDMKDLNKDGIPELIIAGTGSDNHSENIVYEIDTLVNGAPVQLCLSQARARYYLLRDNSVYFYGSSGAAYSSFELYQFKGSSLVPKETLRSDLDDNAVAIWFYSADSGAEESVTEAYAHAKTDGWENSVYLPFLTTIS